MEDLSIINATTLSVFGATFKVITYNFGLNQDFDLTTGHYRGIVFQSPLQINIKGKKEPKLLQWMINSTKAEDGTLTLYNGAQSVSTIGFTGYLVGYTENASDQGVTCSLTIICSSIKAHEVEFTPAQLA